MNVTANSKVSKADCGMVNAILNTINVFIETFINKLINRCPATILALKRTAKVRGRMIILIVSTITINGLKILGVPWGIRCDNNFVIL